MRLDFISLSVMKKLQLLMLIFFYSSNLESHYFLRFIMRLDFILLSVMKKLQLLMLIFFYSSNLESHFFYGSL